MPLRVIISGASSGLGMALARHYAALGATLGLIARQERPLQILVEELSNAFYYVADVRDAQTMRSVAQTFIQHHGCPDIVIANAGISNGTLTEHAEDTEIFENILATNVIGMLNTFQPFIIPMRNSKKGKLVGIASVAGYRGLPGSSAYSASKAAAISYLESLRVEMHGSGISVITICPGYIITPMTENNPFRMPFILTAEKASKKIIHAIENKKLFAVIPWQMSIIARILKLLPNFLYDRLFAKIQHKPRHHI
ncbi:MAG: SDR family oxidoreductase [Nitrosospira sp.]|nr:SDR family oxidoreductase [Nitrosospira sp.]